MAVAGGRSKGAAMIATSERGRARVAPARVGFRTSAKILLLNLGPFAAALVLEPWTESATALSLLARHFGSRFSGSTAAASGAQNPTGRELPVLAAATSLLGICALIIVALKLTNENAKTWSDEAAWIAAFFMSVSIVLSRAKAGRRSEHPWQRNAVYLSYLSGAGALLLSVLLALLLL
jgi:hypothetical protein